MYLKKAEFVLPSSRQGCDEIPTGVSQIEVTPEMLEAAYPFLWDEQVMPWEELDEVLTKIYRAMEMARRRGGTQTDANITCSRVLPGASR